MITPLWSRLGKKMKLFMGALGLIAVMIVGAIVGTLGYLRYTKWVNDDLLFRQIIAITSYNVQQGRLMVPPELQPVAAPTAPPKQAGPPKSPDSTAPPKEP